MQSLVFIGPLSKSDHDFLSSEFEPIVESESFSERSLVYLINPINHVLRGVNYVSNKLNDLF